jgi:hypothetical protein
MNLQFIVILTLATVYAQQPDRVSNPSTPQGRRLQVTMVARQGAKVPGQLVKVSGQAVQNNGQPAPTNEQPVPNYGQPILNDGPPPVSKKSSLLTHPGTDGRIYVSNCYQVPATENCLNFVQVNWDNHLIACIPPKRFPWICNAVNDLTLNNNIAALLPAGQYQLAAGPCATHSNCEGSKSVYEKNSQFCRRCQKDANGKCDETYFVYKCQ